MSYTLDELIEKLQDLKDEFPELSDQVVNVAMQQNYPIAGFIGSVTTISDEDQADCDCPSTKTCPECEKTELWLGINENRNRPYASGEAWND